MRSLRRLKMARRRRAPVLAPRQPIDFPQMSSASGLRDVMSKRIAEQQVLVSEFVKNYGTKKVGEINVNQIYMGMRGMLSMIWETSELCAENGIKFRGLSIEECRKCLPKPEGAKEPYFESVIWLLFSGDIPTEEQCIKLSREIRDREQLPKGIENIIASLPTDMHPMLQFSISMTALSSYSQFKNAYDKGIKKERYWEYVYEDALDLIARAPVVAGRIYRNSNKAVDIDCLKCPTDDMAKRFARNLTCGSKSFADFLRLYLLLHCDHEGGNVSAHTVHLVGSALSDPYLAFAAGLNGLAGPLHGLATQECLNWLKELIAEVGTNPTDDELKKYVRKTLKSGKVVPGYGHAVLRKTDPRFMAQMQFAMEVCAKCPEIELTGRLFGIIPSILKETGKVKNPWPNVDAHSGVLLDSYGIKQQEFYTVMFGVSRSVGVMANLVWARAMRFPIERPKSITTDSLVDMLINVENKPQ